MMSQPLCCVPTVGPHGALEGSLDPAGDWCPAPGSSAGGDITSRESPPNFSAPSTSRSDHPRLGSAADRGSLALQPRKPPQMSQKRPLMSQKRTYRAPVLLPINNRAALIRDVLATGRGHGPGEDRRHPVPLVPADRGTPGLAEGVLRLGRGGDQNPRRAGYEDGTGGLAGSRAVLA